MSERSVVWVRSGATDFCEPCEECRAALELAPGRPRTLALRDAVVEGTLRREADVGFTTCRRGHRVVVRRAAAARAIAAVR